MGRRCADTAHWPGEQAAVADLVHSSSGYDVAERGRLVDRLVLRDELDVEPGGLDGQRPSLGTMARPDEGPSA